MNEKPQYKSDAVKESEVKINVDWAKEQINKLGKDVDLHNLGKDVVLGILKKAQDVNFTNDNPEDSAQVILAMQLTLRRLGMPLSVVDGMWGSETSAAMKSFQEKFGKVYKGKDGQSLVVDGQPGPNVLHAMISILEEKDSAAVQAVKSGMQEGIQQIQPTESEKTKVEEAAVAPVDTATTEESEKHEVSVLDIGKQFGVQLYTQGSIEKELIKKKNDIIEVLNDIRGSMGPEFLKNSIHIAYTREVGEVRIEKNKDEKITKINRGIISLPINFTKEEFKNNLMTALYEENINREKIGKFTSALWSDVEYSDYASVYNTQQILKKLVEEKKINEPTKEIQVIIDYRKMPLFGTDWYTGGKKGHEFIILPNTLDEGKIIEHMNKAVEELTAAKEEE